MDTLRLTVLTMLIPLGWAISVDAYPQPFERSGSTLKPSQASACHIGRSPDPAAELGDGVASAINEMREAVGAIDSTAELHESRNPSGETCRLEFDPVEID